MMSLVNAADFSSLENLRSDTFAKDYHNKLAQRVRDTYIQALEKRSHLSEFGDDCAQFDLDLLSERLFFFFL